MLYHELPGVAGDRPRDLEPVPGPGDRTGGVHRRADRVPVQDRLHRVADVSDPTHNRQAGEPDPPDHVVGRRSGLLPDQPVEGPIGQPGLPEDRAGQDLASDLGEIVLPARGRRQRVGIGAVAEAVAVGIRVEGIGAVLELGHVVEAVIVGVRLVRVAPLPEVGVAILVGDGFSSLKTV